MNSYKSSFNLSSDLIYKPSGHILSLFWSSAARSIAQKFILVFSSVYVYQTFSNIGYDYKKSILLVSLFFALFLVSKLLFLSLAENISRFTGFKGVIWLSAIPFALYIPAIIYAETNPFFFFLAAVLYGMQSAFYWWGYHGYFIKEGDRKHYGGGIGGGEFINTLANITAPLLGGLLIKSNGFPLLYTLAGLFMFLSLILLGRGNDQRQKNDIAFFDVIRLIIKHKDVSSAYIGVGMEGELYVIVWPLFVFLLFGSVVSLGIIVTLSTLFAAMIGVFVGNRIDKKGERNVVAISSPLLSFSWLLKSVSLSLPILVTADSIRNFGEKILSISLIEQTYKKASEAETAKAILFRELAMIIGGFLCVFLAVIVTLLGFDLKSLFL